jgi:hypothetical protein
VYATDKFILLANKQCCGIGARAARIRIILLEPEPKRDAASAPVDAASAPVPTMVVNFNKFFKIDHFHTFSIHISPILKHIKSEEIKTSTIYFEFSLLKKFWLTV